MKRFTIVIAARFDERLLEIDAYLARERTDEYAARVTKAILSKVSSLAKMPKRGRRVAELDDHDVRELLAMNGTYRVI